MFQSVLEQDLPPRSLGRAALLALGFHAAALATVVCASSGLRHPVSLETNPLRMVIAPSPTRPLAAGVVQLVDTPPAAAATKTTKRHETVVQPTRATETPPPVHEPPSGSEAPSGPGTGATGSGAATGGGSATGSGPATGDGPPPPAASHTFGF